MTNKPMLSVERELLELSIAEMSSINPGSAAECAIRAVLHDAKWPHKDEIWEEGGLPPEGRYCEALKNRLTDEWAEGVIVAHLIINRNKCAILQGNDHVIISTASDFRPLGGWPAEEIALSSQQQRPVAWGRFGFLIGSESCDFVTLESPDIQSEKPGVGIRLLATTPLYTEQPAPVAVVMPFAEKVIAKLRRFEECAGDSQDVDIGRKWFDVLTNLGLLERVRRSPAYWEITQQGEDALEVARLNGVNQ